MEKKTLHIDVTDRDKKILQLQEETQTAEAKFVSRENELIIKGRNAFVLSDEIDIILKEFTKKVFTMGFTMACDHLMKNLTLYTGFSYDASVNDEVIKKLETNFKAQVPLSGASEVIDQAKPASLLLNHTLPLTLLTKLLPQ
ncbi:hypothetical protein ACH5RR_017423 [Cinchona calisaya]|uniref:Uncharacterized protein n=1 Tax=Cinchona calisaya TaxID=153742 RepID=A0ABD2ZJG3_9GENT